jgi:hypothetical protein
VRSGEKEEAGAGCQARGIQDGRFKIQEGRSKYGAQGGKLQIQDSIFKIGEVPMKSG